MHIVVADIHMQPHNQDDRNRFLSWLKFIKPMAEEIYILGDLFTYWYSGLENEVSDVSAALDDPSIHILLGNRDFLMLGSKAFPGIIPAEEIIINIYGKKVLLSHGHMLTRGDLGFKCLHAAGWPFLRRLDKKLKPAIKNTWAEFLVRSSSVVRPPHGVIPHDIAQQKKVDTVICGHLHRGFLTDKLIIVPAFLDNQTWLGIDVNGAAFYARR